MFADALAYHPFGPVMLLVAVAIIVVSLVGPARRQRITASLDCHRSLTNSVYGALTGLFVAYGTLRALAYLL